MEWQVQADIMATRPELRWVQAHLSQQEIKVWIWVITTIYWTAGV